MSENEKMDGRVKELDEEDMKKVSGGLPLIPTVVTTRVSDVSTGASDTDTSDEADDETEQPDNERPAACFQ